MLSGDNSILQKATDAKEKTIVAGEKEQIQLEVLGSHENDGTFLVGTVNANIKNHISGVTTDDATEFPLTVTYTATENKYEVFADGKVKKQGPQVSYTNERIVTSSDGTGTSIEEKSKEEGEKLYIYFEASVEGGKIDSISPNVPFEITKNGSYMFTVNYTANGETYVTKHLVEVKQYSSRIGIHVGDYINYTPKVNSTKYLKDNLDELHTGSTKNSSDIRQENLKWKVLKIYDDGKLDLIADLTTNSVYFSRATGYNNGVYIMHDICEKLYSNTAHNIIARSVDLSDFENNMTEDGIKARNEYNKESNSMSQYGKTNYEKWGKSYTRSNSYYPRIYANEIGAGIDTENGDIKEKGIKNTEKGSLDLSTGASAYKQAETNLTTLSNYYTNSIDTTNYGDASKVLFYGSYNDAYWVASRYVGCFSTEAKFGLRSALGNIFNGELLFFSSRYGTYREYGYKLRPVVQIGADVKVTVSNNASTDSTKPHKINW